MYAAVRKVRTRYNESVRSSQRDGSVKRTVCGSKEAACEASKCVAADSVSFGGDGDGGTKEERETSEGVAVGACGEPGTLCDLCGGAWVYH